jgi:hypothetical protein
VTLGYGPHIVPINENQIWIQGGIVSAEFISDTSIYHTQSKSFEEQPFGPINGAGACVKQGSKIFIFGGATRDIYEPSDQSHYFCLLNFTWTSISPLPCKSYNNTGALKNNEIAIVGQHLPSLFLYNPTEDHYREFQKIPEPYKILLIHENNFYILTQYSLKTFKNNEWTESALSIPEPFTLIYSYPVFREGFIYFICPAQTIARLDLSKNTVEVISR